MFPSPSPSPSPSPGPAFLYNQHLGHGHGHGHGGHNHGGHNGHASAGLGAIGGAAGGGLGNGLGGNASGGSPFDGPGGANGFPPLGRYPPNNLAWGAAGGGGMNLGSGALNAGARGGSGTGAGHASNPSLSSLNSLAHTHAGTNGAGPIGMNAPGSPNYGHGPGPLHHPHAGALGHHHHTGHGLHGPSGLSQLASSPGVGMSIGGHSTSSSSQPSASNSAHWNQQLVKAEISRASSSPHHHARAAALAARSATSAAIAIQDPNKAGRGAANGLHLSSSLKKDTADGGSDDGAHANGRAGAKGKGESDKKEKSGGWTTIDMGGLGLKNLAKEVFRYDFLTSLFVNHNALSTISPSIMQLKNLTILDASGNRLVSLPPEMGMLTQLRELFLFDNQLETLPSEMGTLYQLEVLGVEGNPLQENLLGLVQKDGTQALIAHLRDTCQVPMPPPEREWINIDADLPPPPPANDESTPAPPPEVFNVLSYNVLCERYATPQMYGYTPSWALAWDYRKEFILQEVMSYSADICCLQEVDSEQYEDYFLHHLSQQDYEGVFWPKSRARTMRDEERRRVDGCATFFKSNKYALIEKQLIEFNQTALQRPDFKKTEDMFNRVMTKDNIATVSLLENRQSGSRLIVANAHIYWDPEFRDVKLVQTAMLMDELEKIAARFAKFPPKLDLAEGFPPAPKYTDGTKIPTVVCGDFNSVPKSGVYEYLSGGAIRGDHEDFMSHIYGNYTSEGLGHKLPLKSAYANMGEMEFTNYTPGFEGCIDYIWYNQNALAVTGLLDGVDKGYLEKVVGFPNAHYPSDHICILSEFRVKHPKEPPVAKPADFGNSFSSRDRR